MTDQPATSMPEFSALSVMTLVSDPVRAQKLFLMLGNMGVERFENALSLADAISRLSESTFDIIVADLDSDDQGALLLPETLRTNTTLPVHQRPRVLWWGEYSPAAARPRRSAWLGRNTVVNDREFARVGGVNLSALECHASLARSAGLQIEITRSGGPLGLHDALTALTRQHTVKADNCIDIESLTDEEVVRAVISGDGLYVEFQLQHDLQTRDIVGAEVLASWQHPTLGDIPSTQLLPVVRRLGLDLLLFGFMRNRVISVLNELRARRAEVPMAVGISSQAICTPEFVQRLTSSMHGANLSPGLLKIELTEDTHTVDDLTLSTVLNTLRACGFIVSLSGFGVRPAALERVARMPFDEIKIDASFVSDIESLVTCRGIVAAAIDLARLLDVGIVAEGIESEGCVTSLRRLGCRVGQGNALSARMSAHDFVKHVIDSRTN
ncbi:EAL domain-containing protein [Paraburkholderia acidicola]|uniref:EAL domain-containing protein n=1 Tax=Paraburkholderia acidicola TaxID=1912599 RepID=A0ABV1LSZ6_9BURK